MSPNAGPHAGRYRGWLVVWAMLIGYASLYPFFPMRPPSPETVAGFILKPRFVVASDIAWNVIAYLPLGALACVHFAQSMPRSRAFGRAIATAAVLSVSMEALQLFIPGRVSSVYDVIANTVGATLGACVLAEPFDSAIVRPLGALRERLVIPGAWGDAGLVLVALWLIAQLNPALPFFGAGNIVGTDTEVIEQSALQMGAVALSVCGFGLFISALLAGGSGALRVTLVLLSVALWLKFLGATFMLQPHFSAEWVSAGRLAGLFVGLIFLVPLRRIPRLGRIYLAAMTILAGALFAKIFGAYSGLDDFLRMFRWAHGQLASFATLTRFLHELWPIAALVFLMALFFHVKRDPAGA